MGPRETELYWWSSRGSECWQVAARGVGGSGAGRQPDLGIILNKQPKYIPQWLYQRVCKSIRRCLQFGSSFGTGVHAGEQPASVLDLTTTLCRERAVRLCGQRVFADYVRGS